MLLNQTRALEYLQRCDLAAIIATSATHITYLSDYQYWGDKVVRGYMNRPGATSGLATENYALLTAAGDGALVIPPLLMPETEVCWVSEVRTFGNPRVDDALVPSHLPAQAQLWFDRLHGPQPATPVEALIGLLRDWGLSQARLGLELEGVTPTAHAALLAALPAATFLDCSNLFRLIRAVKSEEEIHRISRATLIAEEAAQASLCQAAPGRRLPEFVRAFRAGIGQQGADFDHFIFGVHGLGVGEFANYELQAGDALLVDYGCRYQHYVSDSGLTLSLGDPPPALAERYTTLYEALQAGAALLRPGARASAARGAMRSYLADHGITTCNAHGHGFGLEVRDYPIIVDDTGLRLKDDCIDLPADLPLEADMVINLETPLYLSGAASLHAEQTFLVTPAGGKLLVPLERRKPLQPAARV
ncbi:MAG: aminopeptidase P family protein [Anaerolineales bacterium]|nr:aminopeptidase P family protein [Anaerolineales bacterium]